MIILIIINIDKHKQESKWHNNFQYYFSYRVRSDHFFPDLRSYSDNYIVDQMSNLILHDLFEIGARWDLRKNN